MACPTTRLVIDWSHQSRLHLAQLPIWCYPPQSCHDKEGIGRVAGWTSHSGGVDALAWSVAFAMKRRKTDNRSSVTVGWREWLSLPELGIPAIKAKMDTGARTSSLHTYAIETFHDHGVEKVRFGIHPLQRRRDVGLICTADVVDRRFVTDSGGRREFRYVIRSPVSLGGIQWPIEITLTNRDTMLFRMLFGRSAMSGQVIVDPCRSFLTGRKSPKFYYRQKGREG